MQAKREKVPARTKRNTGTRCRRRSGRHPIDRIVSAGRKGVAASFRCLARGAKGLRQKIFPGNAREVGNFRQMFDRHRPPLADRARTFSDACSQATETSTFSFEICSELFHAVKLSGAEFSVKLIYSAPLHRNTLRFGGVCRP